MHCEEKGSVLWTYILKALNTKYVKDLNNV